MFDAKNFWLYLVNHNRDFDNTPENLESFYNFWMFSFKTNPEWLNFKNNKRDLEIVDKVFKENKQFKAIADEYGIHPSSVAKICRDYTSNIRNSYNVSGVSSIPFFTKELEKGVWYLDTDNIVMLPISSSISNALRRAGLNSINEIYNLSEKDLKCIRCLGKESLKTLIEVISIKVYGSMGMSDYLLSKIDCGVSLTYIDLYNLLLHYQLGYEIYDCKGGKQYIRALCGLGSKTFRLDYIHYINSTKLPSFNSQPCELK